MSLNIKQGIYFHIMSLLAFVCGRRTLVPFKSLSTTFMDLNLQVYEVSETLVSNYTVKIGLERTIHIKNVVSAPHQYINSSV